MYRFVAFALVCCFVAVLILIGCGGSGNSAYALSVSRLSRVNNAMIAYADDYDGVYPLSGVWMDAVGAYLTDPEALRSPAVENLGYGYALNSAIAGQARSIIADPDATLSVFDSTDLSRNATQSPSSLPSPPRYGLRNTLGYVDGHVLDYLAFANPQTLYEISQNRLRQVSSALIYDASDHDDYAPLADRWMDGLAPYASSQRIFKSPAVEKLDPASYGFAMNSAMAGTFLPGLPSPSSAVMFFDSNLLGRNATGPLSTQPNPPRYGQFNTIAYADGHVP